MMSKKNPADKRYYEIHIHRQVNRAIYPLSRKESEPIRQTIWSLQMNPKPEGSQLLDDINRIYEYRIAETPYTLLYQVVERERFFVRILSLKTL